MTVVTQQLDPFAAPRPRRPVTTFSGQVLWPQHHIEAFKALLAEPDRPQRTALIAAELNRRLGSTYSKNAIIGKTHRLKLGSGLFTPKTVQSTEAAIAKRAQRLARRARQAEMRASLGVAFDIKKRIKRTQPMEIKFDHDSAIPVEQRKSLWDEWTGCHWPCGDPSRHEEFFFCGGEKVAGHPYCETHCCWAYRAR